MDKILTFPYLDDVVDYVSDINGFFKIKGCSKLLYVFENQLTVIDDEKLTELVRKKFYYRETTAKVAKEICEFIRQKSKEVKDVSSKER